MLLVLIPFFGFRVLSEALGERRLERMFFVARSIRAGQVTCGDGYRAKQVLRVLRTAAFHGLCLEKSPIITQGPSHTEWGTNSALILHAAAIPHTIRNKPKFGIKSDFFSTIHRQPTLGAYLQADRVKRVPIIYEVDQSVTGAARHTPDHRIQHGRPIFAMSASFHVDEPGFEHAAKMPLVTPPEDLPNEQEMKSGVLPLMPDPVRAYYERERPIELRPVEFQRYLSRAPMQPVFNIWIRATGRLPDDPAIHQCVLAYASDMTLLDASLVAHGRTVFERSIQPASLDHALWFHRPFRADDGASTHRTARARTAHAAFPGASFLRATARWSLRSRKKA